ncbi:MAG: flagellar biosynthetic protein FliR [Myxococcales bacterium]
MSLATLPSEVGLFALETVRTSGVIIVAPLVWAQAPIQAKVGLILGITVLVHGMVPVDPSIESLGQIAMAVPLEFLVGVAMGLVVRISVSAVQTTNELMAMSLGLSMAQMMDPHAEVSETALGKMLRNLALLVAMILGLHRVVLGSLIASFRVLPPGRLFSPAPIASLLTEFSTSAIAAGVRLAVPIVAVLVITQVSLAFISRAAPALQVFSMGFGLMLGVGLAVIMMALPDLTRQLESEFGRVGPALERLVSILVEG